MKVRHGDFENLRADPRKWARAQIAPTTRPSMSYAHLARMAIYRYHKTKDLDDALRSLHKYADSHKRHNAKKLDEAEGRVTAYVAWLATAQPVVVKVKLNVRFGLMPDMYLAGELPRIDIDLSTGGYNAMLIQETDNAWQTELRLPLLQLAVASRLERDPADVSIGLQVMDDWSDIQVVRFSDVELQTALTEAQALCSAALGELNRP